MKLSSASLAFISVIVPLIPQQSLALKCGINSVTKPCIGETDIRYDPEASYNLEDQNDYWKREGEGLYMAESISFTADGEKRSSTFLTGTSMEALNLGTYDFSKMKTFVNNTVAGSRWISHQYHLAKHNGDGVVPGIPGIVYAYDMYYASTFEKDGTMQSLAVQSEFGQELIVSDDVTTVTPIGGRASMGMDPFGNVTQTSYCMDDSCDKIAQTNDYYVTDLETGETSIFTFLRRTLTRVDKTTWMSELEQALNDFNIPSSDAPFTTIPGFDGPNFIKPFDPTSEDPPECYNLICPTEDFWAQRDPALGMSPYIEPDGVLTGLFIAIVTVLSITIACVIFYYIFKRGVEARERRVKEAVLKSIAKSMNITTSKALSPSDLEHMFNKIDADGNGNLSKAEVKGLVEEEGVANMSDKDYDVLFSSIDVDENGTVDFIEFCAFFTSIPMGEVTKEDDKFHEA